MLRRRRASLTAKSSVPYGIETLKCLESPLEGKTYINTGILPDGNVFIDTYAAVANDLNGYESYVCGSNTYGNGVVQRGVILLAKLANDFQQKVWFGNKNHQFSKISDCDKHRWVFKDKKLSIDNELIYDFSDVETTTSNAPLVVFGDGNRWINSSQGNIDTVDGGSNTKIFSFQMRCNDKSINLVPSLDKTGNPCMFDLVSRKNFYNAGTGQFKYIRLNGLPSDYTQVEYLESDDKCGISTGYYPTNKTAVQTEVNVLNNKIYGRVFGTYGGGQNGSYTLYFNGGTLTADFYSRHTKNNSCEFNKKTHIHFGQDGIILDGNLIITPNKISNWTSSIELDIWSCGANENIEEKVSGNMRVYWFKIFEDGQIVRNYIPALDPNGIPCMYDTVGQKPYYNAGTGNFKYVRLNGLPSDYTPVEYLQAGAYSYIETNYAIEPDDVIYSKVLIPQQYTTPYFQNANRAKVMLDYWGTRANTWFGDNTDSQIVMYDFSLNKVREVYNSTACTKLDGDIRIRNISNYDKNQVTDKLTLFAKTHRHDINTPHVGGRIYRFTITNHGKTVMDLLPVLDKNGRPCMYDVISQKALYNNGAGQLKFIYPDGTPSDWTPEVPSNYTPIEYLEGTGDQWIDTQYFAKKQKTKFYFDYKVEKFPEVYTGDAGIAPLMSDSDGTKSNVSITSYQRGSVYCYWFGNPNIDPVNFKTSTRYQAEFFKNGAFYVGGYVPLETPSGDETSTSTVTFFQTRAKGWNSYSLKFYNFKIYEDEILVKNFVPVLDQSGVPCMFETVSQTPHYNAGTGEFKFIRPNGLPSDYTPVEYLESTGTQWIQTDYCPCSETKIKSDCYFVQTGTNGRFFGNGSTYSGGTDTFTTFMSAYTTGAIILDFADVRKDRNNYNLSVGDHSFVVDKNGIEIDGKLELQTNHTKTFKSSNPLSFFANGGLLSQAGDYWKIYNFIIYENDELKQSFVPYLDPTGTPCMYDTVTQTTYYNAGTGDFLYPSPTSSVTYSMRRPRAEYAKMTDTGVRRLYHVPVDYDGSIEEYASEHGYKLLNETDSPSEEGKYYNFRWVETDTELTTEWYEVEPPTDELGNPIENIDEPQSSTFNLQRPAPIDTTVYSNNSQWAMMTDTGVHKIYHTPIGYEGTLEEYAIQNGFKQLIETESPNEEGKYYSFKWIETDDTLITEWFEVDPPQEEIFEENLDNPTK